MKYTKLFFTLAAVVLLTGCSEKNDLQGAYAEQVPVMLTAGSGTASARRAAGDLYTPTSGFDGGEQVKVWMYKNETDGTVSALYDVGTPTAGISALTLSSGETAMFYPASTTGIVTFYGAYPASSLTSHTVKYNQTNTDEGNANYKASDLMYARTDATWTGGQQLTLRPNLPFQHQLCKLTVTLVKTTDVAKIEGVRMLNVKRSVPVSDISIGGMTLGAAASATGETAAEGDNKDEILLSETGEDESADEETYVYSCVFVPQEWDDANIFQVDADGATAYFATSKTFEGGKAYSTTITLHGTSFSATATIGDWTETSLDTDQDIPIVGNPYAYATTYPAAKQLVYTGSAQELVTAATGVVGGTIKYAMTTTATAPDKSTFTEDIPTATEVGTYYIWYFIEGDADHQDSFVRGIDAHARIIKTGALLDGGTVIKVYTSETGGYTISKTDTGTSLSWTYDASWGSKEQWEEIFKTVSGNSSYSEGYSVLNTAVSNAGITGWSVMEDTYWSSTEVNDTDSWYFDEDYGWEPDHKDKPGHVRTISAFSD